MHQEVILILTSAPSERRKPFLGHPMLSRIHELKLGLKLPTCDIILSFISYLLSEI
jgi:hypothetical protein